MSAILYPSTINGEVGKATQYQKTPIESLSKTPTTKEVKEAVVYAAEKYGINETQFYQTIQCESSFRYWAFAPNKYGGSYGVAQFLPGTFHSACAGSYSSPADQIVCAAQQFALEKQSQWDCWCLNFGKNNASCKKRLKL